MAEEKKTPKKKLDTALKRRKQDEKKCMQNRVLKSRVHTERIKFAKETDPTKKKTLLNSVYSIIDKTVKKGIFKKNKAARLKSRLTTKI